jgi:hypothetical protein
MFATYSKPDYSCVRIIPTTSQERKMKLNVCGVKRVTGNAKSDGAPFDISRVLCLIPIEAGAFGKVKITGFGFELAELEVSPEAIPQFDGLKLPAFVELATETKFMRGKLETVVTGVIKTPQVASVRQ